MEQYKENETMERETSFNEAESKTTHKEGFKPSTGFLILCAGCIWALYELVKSIIYFF